MTDTSIGTGDTIIHRRLRILCLEDDISDRELIAKRLAKEGLACEFTYVTNEREFKKALVRPQLDAIISDFALPGYDGMAALAAVAKLRPEVPFILVSGNIGEERAVEALKCGAADYILKDRMERLAPALKRALREAELKQAHRQTREAEQELHQSEERFRSVWERSVDGMRLTDRGGRIIAVNEAYCQLVKLPRERLIGHLFSVVYQDTNINDGIEIYRQRFESGTIEPRLTARVTLWNSEIQELDVSSSFIELGQRGKLVLSIFRDVTTRKRAEQQAEAFARLGERLSAAKSAREAAEIIVDVADQLHGWDSCLFDIYSPAENTLAHILSIDIVNGDRAECQPAVMKREPTPFARRVLDHGGQLVLRENSEGMPPDAVPFGDTARSSASLLYVPVRNRGKILGLLSIQSYSARAYNEESLCSLQALADHCGGALERLNNEEALRTMQEQLRQVQKMEAIGQLAGGVAHDFNNLLVVMRGNAELLLMDEAVHSADTLDSLKQIVAAAERAANLTRQLLAFSRKQVMQSQPLQLNDLIANLTKMLNRIIGEHIQLQCHYGAGLPHIQADPGMVEQVLVNLVVNARDAMPKGGHLHIATERVNLNETQARYNPEARPGEFVSLAVRDTGTGIAPENLPRIFEPFFTTKEAAKGTGLGLATVYGIVKQHQGWIEVSSQINSGTLFRVMLPAIPLPPPQTATQTKTEKSLRGGNETILLAEDDTAVRITTKRVLESVGYKVIEAASGRQALQVWEARGKEVALLLTDMVMPEGVNGRELAECLRQKAPNLKVIFMSGYNAEIAGKDTDFFRKINGRFLQKPCSARALLENVRSCLDEPA